MTKTWSEDPRVKSMDPKKLEFLTDFAKKVEQTPKDQLMSTFMSLNSEAKQKDVQFSNQETDILVEILTANMTPAEKQRLETLRLLSQKFTKQK